MSTPAQVRSTEAIEAFNRAMASFADRVENALDALDADMRRADDWIDHDRPSHWRNQVQQAEDALHQAKQDLEHCLLMTSVDGSRPSCREQKAAVASAKTRLEYCRDKLEIVKKWQRNFRHDVLELRGRLGQLRRVVEQDVPYARALLDKTVERIVLYQLERVPIAADAHGVSPPASGEAYVRQSPPSADPVAPAASTPRSPADE